MSPYEFLVAMGASIVLCSRLDGLVHVKIRFDGQVGSVRRCLVEIRNWFNWRRRWPLHVRCCRKVHVSYLISWWVLVWQVSTVL